MILVTLDQVLNLGDLKEAMLAHICTDSKSFFKSQQVDDPELDFFQKKTIAVEILNESHLKFLQRFATNIMKKHLQFFELQTYQNGEHEEISENIRNIKYALDNQKSIVRNRRYAALIKLVKEKKYFSESEMRSRHPLLFEQLVGQYQSTDKKRANRRPDPKTDTLVDVLLEGIDHDFNKAVENRQRAEEEEILRNDEYIEEAEPDDSDSGEESDHQQWGNFEDTEPNTSSTIKPRKRPAKLITAGERDLLLEEFTGVMHSNFMSGKDNEFFDYNTVDNNEEYDDIFETNQDCEDKYFEDVSEDPPAQPMTEDGSDDELDVYMRCLDKNLRQYEIQEFDED